MDNDVTKDDKTVDTKMDDKSTEIDWSKVDPSTIPTHVVQQTAHFQGLVRDKEDFRLKNQNLLEANELLQGELERQTESPDEDDDTEITKKDAKALVQKALEEERKKNETEQKKKDETVRQNKINVSSTELLAKYPKEGKNAMPKGLDAKTVIFEGSSWLVVNKPRLFEAARNSENPAQEIYDLACAYVPSIKARIDKNKNEKFLSEINLSGIPRGGGGGVTDSDEVMALIGMPEDKLMALAEQDDLR